MKIKETVKKHSWLFILTVLIAGIILGLIISPDKTPQSKKTGPALLQKEEVKWWTCSMHPQVKLPEQGLCPICNMELIPLKEQKTKEISPRELEVSREAKALMDIQTRPVERRYAAAEIRMTGKVDYDETLVEYITSWMPGRIERLFVDYTGIPVEKGEHMLDIYSPELISAQEELLQAKRSVENITGSNSQLVRESTESTLRAAREKLRLLGLKQKQIKEVEETGKVREFITIYAPSSGIVIHKNAKEGMYVDTGTRLYTTADLSQVWVKLDAYESDLIWLRYGQKVEFTTVSYPGETFTGIISFIDPLLDPVTRTVNVRVNVPNPDGKLKPEMFVKAVVNSRVAASGKVMSKRLIGKYICSMHPSVIEDEPGDCRVCGMPLVTTESLGYISIDEEKEAEPLIIPASAPLITGTRAVVYLEVPDTNKPSYRGKEIVLGPRVGDFYIVKEGLKEGQQVVTRGNFKIDSALQIQAKPSMMMPEGGGTSAPQKEHKMKHEHRHEKQIKINPEVRKSLDKVFSSYIKTSQFLANDDFKNAKESVSDIAGQIQQLDSISLKEPASKFIKSKATEILKTLNTLTEDKNINDFRKHFATLSEEFADLAGKSGSPFDSPIYILKCPMAFDNRGAIWLQRDKVTENPYYGSAMLKCGSVIETIESLHNGGDDE